MNGSSAGSDGTGKGSHMHAGTEAHKDPPSSDSNPSHGLNFWNPHYHESGARCPPSQSSNLPDLGEGKLRKLVAAARYTTALSIAVACIIAAAALSMAWDARRCGSTCSGVLMHVNCPLPALRPRQQSCHARGAEVSLHE